MILDKTLCSVYIGIGKEFAMALQFHKMQGAGNDFIVADDPGRLWNTNPDFIRTICDRHKGIGADGLILLRNTGGDSLPEMEFFNSDGLPASMCGNGLRCTASFLYREGLCGRRRKQTILCWGKEQGSEIMNDDATQVRITMEISEEFRPYRLENGEPVYKGTVGVPHVIAVRNDVSALDIETEGRRLRSHPLFQPDGANADFVSFRDPAQKEPVLIRTYERGVEAETLACGTGCASAAVVLHQFFRFPEKVSLLCRGKDHIEVEIFKFCSKLKGVFLTGPAETVFVGEISG